MEFKFNSTNFEEEVLKSNTIVLVDFYADWCGPCKMLGEILKEVDKEAQEILSETRKKAMKMETKIIAEAKEEAARIIERANAQIELEKKHALDDMKQEMITIASMMAQKVVAASIDTNVQESLIDETLKEMGEGTWLS